LRRHPGYGHDDVGQPCDRDGHAGASETADDRLGTGGLLAQHDQGRERHRTERDDERRTERLGDPDPPGRPGELANHADDEARGGHVPEWSERRRPDHHRGNVGREANRDADAEHDPGCRRPAGDRPGSDEQQLYAEDHDRVRRLRGLRADNETGRQEQCEPGDPERQQPLDPYRLRLIVGLVDGERAERHRLAGRTPFLATLVAITRRSASGRRGCWHAPIVPDPTSGMHTRATSVKIVLREGSRAGSPG
jgi:hypothetical protein